MKVIVEVRDDILEPEAFVKSVLREGLQVVEQYVSSRQLSAHFNKKFPSIEVAEQTAMRDPEAHEVVLPWVIVISASEEIEEDEIVVYGPFSTHVEASAYAVANLPDEPYTLCEVRAEVPPPVKVRCLSGTLFVHPDYGLTMVQMTDRGYIQFATETGKVFTLHEARQQRWTKRISDVRYPDYVKSEADLARFAEEWL